MKMTLLISLYDSVQLLLLITTLGGNVLLPTRFGAYRGIGVRIEDDVLVTAEGCQILSRAVPTARSDIEHLILAQ
jgi:hypothetical protein